MIVKNPRIAIALCIFLGASITASAQSTGAETKKTQTTKASRPKTSAAADGADWRQIKKPELPAFHPKEPKRVQFANGMIVFLQEDHELPLIDGTAYIRGGARDVPAAKTGMTSIYASSWRTGGTKTKTGDQQTRLDERPNIRNRGPHNPEGHAQQEHNRLGLQLGRQFPLQPSARGHNNYDATKDRSDNGQ